MSTAGTAPLRSRPPLIDGTVRRSTLYYVKIKNGEIASNVLGAGEVRPNVHHELGHSLVPFVHPLSRAVEEADHFVAVSDAQMSRTRTEERVQRELIDVIVYVKMNRRRDVSGHVDHSLQENAAGDHLKIPYG